MSIIILHKVVRISPQLLHGAVNYRCRTKSPCRPVWHNGCRSAAHGLNQSYTCPEKAAVTISGKIADVRTPIKNLYLAGTDTDSRSMGITRAAYSIIGMLCALNEDGNLH